MAQTNGGLPDGYKPGLEGVIAGVSSICEVDAVKDALSYVGYPAHELAAQSNYLEVAYLLLHQKLPSAAELETFRQNVLNQRALSVEMITFLKSLPKKGDIMTGLAAAVSYLHMQDPAEAKIDATSNLNKAINLIAKSPTIVAALHRIHQGKDPIAPNPTLDHAANFLYMVTGKDVDSETAKAFDSTMILYAEHGYNASTFSALVTASTLTDLYSAIVAAIGTLKGPLHGGANEGAIEMLLKIGDGMAVTIKHGKYFTTYSNLTGVSVSKGSSVRTGQAIGKAGRDDEGGGGQIDFILLKKNRHRIQLPYL
jgi:citrate synthase